MSTMSKELDCKAGTVARLMTELHTMKVKLKASRQAQGESKAQGPEVTPVRTSVGSAGSSRSVRSSGSGSARSEDGHHEQIQPLPPKEAPPKSRRRHSGRLASLDASSTQAASVKNRGPSSRKLSASSDNADLIPDPTPFLLLNKEGSASSLTCPSFKQSGKAPLPPIADRSGDIHNGGSLLPQSADSFKFVHHGNSTSRGRGGSPSSPEVEVETLAVDQVAKRTHSLRKAHEYRSSDY